MNNKKLIINVLFTILIIGMPILILSLPSYDIYCSDGDDIIDDDLCVHLSSDGEVSLYHSFKERNYAEIVFAVMVVILLFFIWYLWSIIFLYGDY